jgi:hypothetical protein
MSMTNRREPRERSDRPANRHHNTPHHQPDNGHQPLPLDNHSSIWATLRSCRSGPIGATPRYRIRAKSKRLRNPVLANRELDKRRLSVLLASRRWRAEGPTWLLRIFVLPWLARLLRKSRESVRSDLTSPSQPPM